jgi:hypothetical protein
MNYSKVYFKNTIKKLKLLILLKLILKYFGRAILFN